jgi:TolB-like protein
MNRRTAVLCAFTLVASGCAHALKVTSDPPGARVLLDGKDTGEKTPASFNPRAIPSGQHKLSVQLEGFNTPAERSVENSRSVGLVVWSIIFFPVGIYNIFHGFSKNSPEALHFPLRDGGGPGVDSQATSRPPVVVGSGDRRHISAAGTKCAAMPLRTKDVGEAAKMISDELVLSELQQAGFQAIGPDDINSLLGFEKTKQAVGCDEASCAAELGAALGVGYLVAGSVTALEGSMVLTLKLIDVKNTRVLARASRVVEGGQSALPQMIALAVNDLVTQSGL